MQILQLRLSGGVGVSLPLITALIVIATRVQVNYIKTIRTRSHAQISATMESNMIRTPNEQSDLTD